MEPKFVDPKPFCQTLRDLGYVHVHTWYEGHGDGRQETYQKPGSKMNLIICINRMGALSTFYQEGGAYFKNYLLAKEIKENKESRYERLQTDISLCSTAAFEIWVDKWYDDEHRVVSVAGHGSYVTE